MTRFLLLLALLLSTVTLRADEKPPLRVGMEMSYPPFEMTDPKGKPIGVSVDLALALGKALGRRVEFEDIPFPGLIPALRTGKIDCIISSMTATPERSRSVAFSQPYVKTGLSLLVAKDSGVSDIPSLDQPGRTVTVKKGTTGHLYASRHLKNAKVLVFDSESRCVLEVTQGKADAFVYDQISVYVHWKKYPESTIAYLKPFQEEEWAIAVQLGNETLLRQINEFLSEFRAKGGFDELSRKWLSDVKADFDKLGIPFFF